MFDDSWLDKPVIAQPRISRWVLLYALLIVFILGTRLWDLGSRAYCHDESIHAWESWKLANGLGYVHDPAYHGPFLYHIQALVFALFGDTDVTGRLAAVVGGILITFSPWFLRRWLGRWGLLAATLFMALSPVLMHRSRYIRHDQWAIVANLVLLWAILQYLERRRDGHLYLAAAAIGWSLTTKETTFITFALFGAFLAGYALWQWLRAKGTREREDLEARDSGEELSASESPSLPVPKPPRRRLATLVALPVFDLLVVIGTLILPTASPFVIKLMGRNPADISAEGIVLSTVVWIGVALVAAAIGLLWDRRRWLVCAALFYIIFVPLFTTFFTNLQGFATGMVGQLGYWLSQQGVRRGSQPWFYYFLLLGMYEFAAVVVGTGTILYAAARAAIPVPQVSKLAESPATQEPQVGQLAVQGRDVPQVSKLAESPATQEPQAGQLALQGQDVPQVSKLAESPATRDSQGGQLAVSSPAPFLSFLIWWFLGAVLLYTWAGEKMPWLMMHMVVPLDLLAGWGLGRLAEGTIRGHGDADTRRLADTGTGQTPSSARVATSPGRHVLGWALLVVVPLLILFTLLTGKTIGSGSSLNTWGAYWLRWIAGFLVVAWVAWLALRGGMRQAARLAALSLVATLLLLTVRVSWNVTYRHADLANEFLVYAQGSPDVARVARDIDALSYRVTGGLDIKLAYDEDAAWPWIWYLRNYTNAQYFRTKPSEPIDADIVIVGETNEAALKPLLEQNYVGHQYRLIWWPNEDWYKSWTLPGLRQQLGTAQGRAAFWDVLWNRKFEFSLQDWPPHLVHTFTVYVRKDLALPLGAPLGAPLISPLGQDPTPRAGGS